MQKAVIIDLSWVMYRSYYTFLNFSFIDSENKVVPTGAIYGVLRQHLALREAFPGATFHYAIEPEVNPRYQYDANYKSGRKHTPESKAATFGMQWHMVSMLRLFPDTNVWTAKEGEADDVINTLATQYACTHETYVFSADNDLLPLMSKGVKIFRSLKKDAIGYVADDYIKEKFGIDAPPDSIPLLKIVRGDRSDNIPVAVERFPTRLLATALKECNCKTVDQLLEAAKNGIMAEAKLGRLLDAEAKLRHNEKLVTLQLVDIYAEPFVSREPRFFIVNFGLKSIRKAFPEA